MLNKNILIASLFLGTTFGFAQQYGGMWIPTELNEKEMKDLGMKISAKDIFNTEKPSINIIGKTKSKKKLRYGMRFSTGKNYQF